MLKNKIAFLFHHPFKSLRTYISKIQRYILIHLKYPSSVYILYINGIQVKYSTKDLYSKIWFHSRYNKERIHEKKVTQILINLLSNSSCFVDVGSHLGYYTCLASKIMRNGYVYGFEMDKHSFNFLRKNINLNNLKKVKIFNYAVYDSEGTVKFAKLNHPFAELSIDIIDSNIKDQMISVKSITLDNFFKNEKVRPDVVKIDAEGSEMNILKGMESLLKKFDIKLFLEMHPWKYDSFKTSSKEIISYLINLGYSVYKIGKFRNQKKREQNGNLIRLSGESTISNNTMVYSFKQ